MSCLLLDCLHFIWWDFRPRWFILSDHITTNLHSTFPSVQPIPLALRSLHPRLLSLLRPLQAPILNQQTQQETQPHHWRQYDKHHAYRLHIGVPHDIQIRRI